MMKICRFCLSQDEAYLIPVVDASDLEIDVQEMALLSGIQIVVESHAMCLECINMLKICSTFRSTCRKNDALFNELCAVLEASAKDPVDIIELSNSSEDSFELDAFSESSMRMYLGEPLGSGSKATTEMSPDEPNIQGDSIVADMNAIIEEIAHDEAFAYSANYIKPGETLYTEEVIHKSYVNWNSSLNPIPRKVHCVRERGRRKLHLCDFCGIKVTHIPTHYEKHSVDPGYTCPHCPVKLKEKYAMSCHIQQVHLKTVSKTCKICGKGFVHHKTYRYHMLTHLSKGKTFECKDCLKTFANASYLRDHINRLHNVAKPAKVTNPDKKVQR
uniref:ZAD domain-containing protein n=1 Tax=Anopheles epiroticus TaxID=199890 RepID=A0A182P537_9DIPT